MSTILAIVIVATAGAGGFQFSDLSDQGLLSSAMASLSYKARQGSRWRTAIGGPAVYSFHNVGMVSTVRMSTCGTVASLQILPDLSQGPKVRSSSH
jgi:hypothetical protein